MNKYLIQIVIFLLATIFFLANEVGLSLSEPARNIILGTLLITGSILFYSLFFKDKRVLNIFIYFSWSVFILSSIGATLYHHAFLLPAIYSTGVMLNLINLIKLRFV